MARDGSVVVLQLQLPDGLTLTLDLVTSRSRAGDVAIALGGGVIAYAGQRVDKGWVSEWVTT